MKFRHKLALLAALALAVVAAMTTVAFATTTQSDATETATTITVNGTRVTVSTGTVNTPTGATGATGTGNPSGNYTATSRTGGITLNAGVVTVVCTSRATFTIDITGTGSITELWFETCVSGINSCVVNSISNSTATTTAVTIVDGGFTVTASTNDVATATFALDGRTATAGGTTAEISGTVVCSALNLDCRFTTPTGGGSGTVPFGATITEGAPGSLSFDNATIDGDTIVTCSNPQMTGSYTLNDPTTAGTDTLSIT